MAFFLVLDIILGDEQSECHSSRARILPAGVCSRGILVRFLRNSALRNAGQRSFIFGHELSSTKQKLHRGEPLVVLRRDSCPGEDGGGTRPVLLRERTRRSY